VVYVLAIGSGLLYRLGGEHDPAELRERMTDDRVAACRCGVIPITAEARFWLTTTCRWKRSDGTPGESRSWTFLVDGIAEPLEIAYRWGEDGVAAFVGDAESFARKLAAEITRAHRQQDERFTR
jgi:hypothetical protein